jgi:predicted enzyme related to lactoylglutathione lyase
MSAFVHLELGTDDTKAASQFYKKVFGWKLTPMKMPDGSSYVMFDTTAGGPGGGIGGKMDPSQPTAWLPYIGVKSLKKSVAKARGLGATIVVDHMPVMGMGALAILIDPTGAKLGLWEPAMSAPPPKKKAAKKTAKKAAKKTAKKTAKR